MGKFHGGGQFFQTEFPWRETFLALDFPYEQVCKCLKIVLEIHGNELKMGLKKKRVHQQKGVDINWSSPIHI